MLLTQGIETSLHEKKEYKERKSFTFKKSNSEKLSYHEICYLDIKLLINYKQTKLLLHLKGKKDEFCSLASQSKLKF